MIPRIILETDPPLQRVRAAIEGYTGDTGGKPLWWSRKAVLSISKAAKAPPDVVRHFLRYPEALNPRKSDSGGL